MSFKQLYANSIWWRENNQFLKDNPMDLTANPDELPVPKQVVHALKALAHTIERATLPPTLEVLDLLEHHFAPRTGRFNWIPPSGWMLTAIEALKMAHWQPETAEQINCARNWDAVEKTIACAIELGPVGLRPPEREKR